MRGFRNRHEAAQARAKGQAVRQAKSAHRLQHLIALSAKGMSKQEAALHVGMTVGGVGSLLTKAFGSKRWPIQTGDAA